METPVSSITSVGDLGGQKVAMGIDQSALAHIMSVLTDLYSDPQLAVIREYSTNALDAHIEAGNTAPIEVYTPSALSPYFKVRDYGVGLSVDDIINMYSQYGASSKRGSNDQVGMLGLGAKSALTLVPQFNLTSVKGGVKIYVSVSRSSDGSGQMEIIDTSATDEPNGVEISIPVPRNHDFARKCKDFFRFWKKGTVLVDGKEPEYLDGRPVGDKFLINKNLQQDYVVMGNVAYPVKDGIYRAGYSQLGVVAFVEIGDVNFTPSRESLHYTAQTKATIDRLQKEFSSKLEASINADIAESKTYAEAWRKAREWRASFYNRLNSLIYKGVSIPTELPCEDGKQVSITSRGQRYAQWVRGVNPEMAKTHMFIVNFAESLKPSPVQREKMAIYCEENGLNYDKVVLTSKPSFVKDIAHSVWMADFVFVDWADIGKIKVVRNKSTNKVIRTDPYDLYDGNYSKKQVSSLDTSKPIIYYSSAELHYPSWLMDMFGKDAQIVILSKNRWEKFGRDYPTGLHYITAVERLRKTYISQMTEADRIMWHHSGYKYSVRSLSADKIDDPDLHLFVEVLSNNNFKFSAAADKVRGTIRRDLTNPVVDVPNNPLTKYPLLGNMRDTDPEHLYWYLNAYYAQLSAEAEKEN